MASTIKIAAKVRKGTSSHANLSHQAMKSSSGNRPIAKSRAQIIVRVKHNKSGQPRRKR